MQCDRAVFVQEDIRLRCTRRSIVEIRESDAGAHFPEDKPFTRALHCLLQGGGDAAECAAIKIAYGLEGDEVGRSSLNAKAYAVFRLG